MSQNYKATFTPFSRLRRLSILLFLFCLSLGVSASALESDKYKKYSPVKDTLVEYKLFEIATFEDSVSFTSFLEDGSVDAELRILISKINSSKSLTYNNKRIELLSKSVDLSKTTRLEVNVDEHPQYSQERLVTLTFWTNEKMLDLTRLSPYERIFTHENYELEPGAFIASSLIGFAGDLQIEGEVNKSVIAIGSDIALGENAVVRDHVISIGGEVQMAEGAHVYGYILPDTYNKNPRLRRRPWEMSRQDLNFVPSFAYNRVDGLTPRVGWKFTDSDSSLPNISLTYGIGIHSERQRGTFSISQTVSRPIGLAMTGSFFKELYSDDEDLLSNWKNTLTSLVAGEDYFNYFEAEGGRIGLEFHPDKKFWLSAEYFSYDAKTLDGSRALWSAFGGDDAFAPNYQELSDSLREFGAMQMDESRTSGITAEFRFENFGEFTRSKTKFGGALRVERALDEFDSDFDFTRLIARGNVQHQLSRYTLLEFRAKSGASSGQLPLYRNFFSGGYRWLRGYDHYEFHGTDFWTTALEYGVKLDEVGLSESIFWIYHDMGGFHTDGSEGVAVHSIGVGVSLWNAIRLNLARRLDRSDADLRFSVEL